MEEENRDNKAKGGYARARVLTPEQRQEIARKAAETRWSSNLPRATHRGKLKIADLEIPCFVLDDGRRVISGRGMTKAIGMKGRGQGIARIASHKALKTNENDKLLMAIQNPIRFYGSSPRSGLPSDGYEATVLQEICEAILRARDKGELKTEQELRYGQYSDMLIRAFAKIGIIALVDEATGYQEIRDRLALQAILDEFLRKEFAAWAKRFPDEFYQHIFRLRGWDWKGMKINRPQVVAKYTNNIVYERLAPGILRELEVRNPVDEKGHRKAKHHQWLTEDVGHPALAQHLYAVMALMRVARDKDWAGFKKMLDHAFPKRGDSFSFTFMNEPASTT